MGALIDASVLIAVEREALDLEKVLARGEEIDVALSAITASELLHGVHRAATGKRRTSREAYVERLLEQIPILSFDIVTARIHARLWAELASTGVTVGERDLMIGATAIARGYSVATRDQRSFPKIPGLKVITW